MRTHLLLDIEGTTSPFSFVVEVLFPYAEENLKPFIKSNYNDVSITRILASANKEWTEDKIQAVCLLASCNKQSLTLKESITKYLSYLMSTDQKSTALKDLQGKIWEQGYKNGTLKSTLFNEVNECIHRWKQKGLTLAVYSSGSVEAQKLLYQHTQTGNLEGLFSTGSTPIQDPKNLTRAIKLSQIQWALKQKTSYLSATIRKNVMLQKLLECKPFSAYEPTIPT